MTNINEIEQLENKAETIRMIINNWKQEITKYETVLLALQEEINQLKIMNKTTKNNAVNSEINSK